MILGEHIDGAHGVIDGAPRPLRSLADGVAHADGILEPVPAERISAVYVLRHDEPRPVPPGFPQPAAFGGFPGLAARQQERTAALHRAVQATLPAGAQRAEIHCTALGRRLELRATVTTDTGSHPWIPAEEVVAELRGHREVGYHPGTGTWTTAQLTVGGSEPPTLTTGSDEPRWLHTPGDRRAYHEELRYYPRSAAPDWLLSAAWEHFTAHRDSTEHRDAVRMARLFDERGADGRPMVARPALPWAEKQQVLAYLHGGEILLTAQSESEDELDPAHPPRVPKQFHTDGAWVWPLACAYYLDKHDIAPERDFLDHIRGHGYQPPREVADRAQAEAKALVLGADPESLQSADPGEAIDFARRFLGAIQVSTRYYGFTAPIDGGWSMLRERDGWWTVSRLQDGKVRDATRYPEPWAAAAHLIGVLSLDRHRYLRAPDEPLQDFECDYTPMAGEPPLAAYDGKRLVLLEADQEIDRYGPPAGNTVYALNTPVPQRFGVPQHAGEYHRYRVVTGFEVIAGIARPEAGLPGGGTAYVLPNSLETLVADGWLSES